MAAEQFSIFTTPEGAWRVRRERDGRVLAQATESGYVDEGGGCVHYTYLDHDFDSLSTAAWALHRAAPGENLDEFKDPPWHGREPLWVDDPG